MQAEGRDREEAAGGAGELDILRLKKGALQNR